MNQTLPAPSLVLAQLRTKSAGGNIDTLRTQASKEIAAYMLMAASLGVLGRAGQGLWRRAKPVISDVPGYLGHPLDLETAMEDETKVAVDLSEILAKWPVKATDALAKVIEGGSRVFGDGVMGGSEARSPWSVPWYWLGFPASMASLYGGYKLTDKALDTVSRAEKQQEMEDLEQEYQKLIRQGLRVKRSESETPCLDALAAQQVDGEDAFEPETKQAGVWDATKSYGSGTLGAYMLYALVSSLLTGKAMYNRLQKRSPSTIMQKAREERAKQMAPGLPVPFYASTSEVPLPLEL